MSYLVTDLPRLKYIGYHQDLKASYYNFQKRLLANDFSGKFELFYEEIAILEKLQNSNHIDILFNNESIPHFICSSISEKVSQLVYQLRFLEQQLAVVENELGKVSEAKFNLQEKYFLLINFIEIIFFKLSSILDLTCNLSHEIYKRINPSLKVPNKYGQQKAWNNETNKFNTPFDELYQNNLLTYVCLNTCHNYRNSFSHETSLKLIPYLQNEKKTIAITFDNSENGLLLGELIETISSELKSFLDYYDNYFYEKIKINCP
jgi:hypothetical protein